MKEQQTDSLGRQLRGTAFLSLEHWLYMLLMVVLPLVMAAGASLAISLWTQTQEAVVPLAWNPIATPSGTDGAAAGQLTAAVVLVAIVSLVLQRRTAAEMAKRPGYRLRLAYRLPLYAALGALVVLKLVADAMMLGVVLYSLTLIGTSAEIGELYMAEFVPALVAAILFGLYGWYLMRLAKGQDRSTMVTTLGVAAALVLGAALLVTTSVQQHEDTNSEPGYRTMPTEPDYSDRLKDLYR